jgi:GNAT superfamily N-acetyltransferase
MVMAAAPPPTIAVDTATLDDLRLLQQWTCWSPERGTPCVVGQRRPQEAFLQRRLRVVSAFDGDEKVGLSLVAAPPHDTPAGGWRAGLAPAIPATECLLWVALAVAPSHRRSGLGLSLAVRTLQMAITTGYPFVAAAFPVDDSRIAGLLSRAGFTAAAPARRGTAEARAYYLRPTPTGYPERDMARPA